MTKQDFDLIVQDCIVIYQLSLKEKKNLLQFRQRLVTYLRIVISEDKYSAPKEDS